MKADDPLSALQLEGIAAASEVFERLAAQLDPDGREPPAAADGPPVEAGDPVGQQQLRSAAARMIDLFAGLVQETFEGYVELAQAVVQPAAGAAGAAGGSGGAAGAAGAAGGSGGAAGAAGAAAGSGNGAGSTAAAGAAGAVAPLALSGPAGGNAAATVWIHNATAAPATEVALRFTDLTAHSGARIDASLARFVPGTLEVPAGASASSLLSLAIPPSAAPGMYFGHVLASALPQAGLPVRLVVDEFSP